ncbi:MAG: hypothetical protein RLN75_02215 [Longimicrobiales bacterium]
MHTLAGPGVSVRRSLQQDVVGMTDSSPPRDQRPRIRLSHLSHGAG